MAFNCFDYSKYRDQALPSYPAVSPKYQKSREIFKDIPEILVDYCTLLQAQDDRIQSALNEIPDYEELRAVVYDVLTDDPNFIEKLFEPILTEITQTYQSLLEKARENMRDLQASLKKENRKRLELEIIVTQNEEKIRQLEETIHQKDVLLGTDSTNSNLPPSSDPIEKKEKRKKERKDAKKDQQETEEKTDKKEPVFNTRVKTDRKPGAQSGHPGKTLSNQSVKELIDQGQVEHEIVELGEIKGDHYKSGFILDLNIKPVIKEIRVPDTESLPEEFWGGPIYGSNIASIAVLLNTEGLIGYSRMAQIINELSENTFSLSEGTAFKLISDFSEKALPEYFGIMQDLTEAPVLYTDMTHFDAGDISGQVRNHSYGNQVWYWPTQSKKKKELFENPLLSNYSNILVHDHETALYSLDCKHAECNIHLIRHLRKMELLTENKWPAKMIKLFEDMDHQRNLRLREDSEPTPFSKEELLKFRIRFEDIISLAKEENKKVSDPKNRKKERTLINRIKRYFKEHTLFLTNFEVDFTNNRSERDLRIVVKKRHMINTFRNFHGLEIYCVSLSIVETLKLQGTPVLQGIKKIFQKSIAH